MLETMRQATQSIAAKIFLGLLVVSFVVWGASGALLGGTSAEAIRVGDTRVSALDYRLAYQTRVSAIEQQLNQRLTLEQAKIFGIQQTVTDQLVSGAVLDESAKGMGLGISDERLVKAIAEDPSFKDGFGNFSSERLKAVLRQVGMSDDSYVRNQQSVALRNQLVSGLSQGIAAPDAFYAAFSQYQTEKRVFDYVVVDRASVPAIAAPGDTELTKWFEENKTKFIAPEYRKLQLVRLIADDIAKPGDLSAQEVAAEYETLKAGYTQPEQRRIQQIAFPDAAAAKAGADKLAGGMTVDALLAELGRTSADADLGLLRRDQIPDKIVADAAFAQELNKPGPIVEGLFGPVIVNVTEIKPQSEKPLAEVEADVRKSLATKKANEVLFDTHDKLEDERAAGDPLADAAAKAGLKAMVIEMVDANGNGPDGKPVEGIPAMAAVLAEAFKTDEGVEADPVNIGSEGFVWFEVTAITPERQKPLEEVREAAIAAWTEDQTLKSIENLANAIRDRTGKGEDFAAVVAAVLPQTDGTPAKPLTSAELLRSDSAADLPLETVRAGFELPQGGAAVSPATTAPGRVVLKVSRIVAGSEETPPANLVEQLNNQISEDLVANLVGDLKSKQEVIINPAAIDAALAF